MSEEMKRRGERDFERGFKIYSAPDSLDRVSWRDYLSWKAGFEKAEARKKQSDSLKRFYEGREEGYENR